MTTSDKERLGGWLSDVITFIRYGLREKADYCSYPANQEDLAHLEALRTAVADLPADDNGMGADLYCLVQESGSHALRGAISALIGTRTAKGKPLTNSERAAIATHLRSKSKNPEMWVRILQSWFLYDDGEAFEAALNRALEKHEKEIARCGNAVTPPVPAALVRANLPEYCGVRE